MTVSDDIVLSVFGVSGRDVAFRKDRPELWDAAWQNFGYQPVYYSGGMIDYQHMYLVDAGWDIDDISLVLMSNGVACGVWPLTIGRKAGKATLTSTGRPVVNPIFVKETPDKTIKKLTARALHAVSALCARLGVVEVRLQEDFSPDDAHKGVGEWQRKALSAGAVPVPGHYLYADLKPPMAEIRSTFRKSYKPLVSRALGEWDVFTMDKARPSADVWSEFEDLHLSVAGRKTRGTDTWEFQYRLLSAGSAFLIGLRDKASGRLVGAGYFQNTADEGLYAVGAYDRALFDRPLGHAVQQTAIEHMKSLGLRWYRLGRRYFGCDNGASEKEQSIGQFKQGFSSHMFCKLELMLKDASLGQLGE